MKTIYKMTEWQSPTGVWYVSNTQDLGHDSGAWWLPARFLNMSLDNYIKMLIDEYHVSYIKFFPDSNKGKSLLIFNWDKYEYAHKYYLWINRMARNNNWLI